MRKTLLLAAALSLLVLTGCRTRLIGDSALADTVLETERPDAVPTETPAPAPAPSPTPIPEQEETIPPEETPPPEETAETTRPDRAVTVSTLGQEQMEAVTALGITVTYDPNGGDGPAVYTVVSAGEAYGPQPEAVRRGYAFTGWWDDPAGGEQVTADTVVTVAEAHTLYAHWQAREASTVTFDGNGGRVKSKEASRSLSEGDTLGTLPTPIREGYEFNGWYTQPEGGERVEEDTVYPGGGDWTLYAQWAYDPYAFWSFTLRNRTQQVYLCQQTSIYFETAEDHVTDRSCALITATGSQNIAESREDPAVTDDWVRAKKPQVVVKEVSSLDNAAALRRELAARFPEQKIVLVTAGGLGEGSEGLYARLALAKELYGDWYTDVDLSVVAAELGIGTSPIDLS